MIKGAREVAVGTLSQCDALQLLAATAEVEEYMPPNDGEAEEDDQYRFACEVVDHCGHLALTVSTVIKSTFHAFTPSDDNVGLGN